MTIGEKIKKLRLTAGMTQLQLGNAVGVTESMICQLERGTKALTVPLAMEIAAALHMTLGEMLAEEESAGKGA